MKIPLHVVESEIANAWTDGTAVFVTGALVEQLEVDEVAAILGHELAHVLRDDVEQARSMREECMTRLSQGVAGGSFAGSVAGFFVRWVALSHHSRKQESAADRLGQRLAARAGYGETSLADALEEIAGSHTEESVFDTHPTTPTRVRALEPNPHRTIRIKIFRRT